MTHINQLVNFTVMLGEDKETVLANRNYNLIYNPSWLGQVTTTSKPPAPRGVSSGRRKKGEYKSNYDTNQTYCRKVTCYLLNIPGRFISSVDCY